MDPVNVLAKFEVRSFTRSRSSKVVDFGTNRKRVCDFLLVRHSKLVTLIVSCTVSDTLQVFLCP